MKIQILFFGIATDYAQTSSIDFEIKSNTTVKDLKIKLLEDFPKLKNLSSYAVAVNETYATDDVLLQENDTIAIIPPVSGG